MLRGFGIVLVLFGSSLSSAEASSRVLLGNRCGTPDRGTRALLYGDPKSWSVPVGSGGTDCSASSTNPDPSYDPGTSYLVDVWVHILRNTTGTLGDVSDALVHSQIQILNEDFRALPGTNGANGTDSRIYFRLAGITRSNNNAWYQDNQDNTLPLGQRWYYQQLAVDPHRFLNIYTNTAGGFLGYVPFLPADGAGTGVGSLGDRVVLAWDAVGRDALGGPPYDQGRTATHEVGHYLGLEHTFARQDELVSCPDPSPPACSSNGDLICDTNPEQTARFGCPVGAASCSSPDPITNYMDYSDDLCMEELTVEQTRRVRCTLENWRPQLGTPVLFYDGFESSSLSEWSGSVP